MARKGERAFRLPFEPLERLIPRRLRDDIGFDQDDRLVQVAEVLGCERRSVLRYRTRGLSVEKADEYAVRLGLVPEIIDGWDEFLPVLEADDDEEDDDG